jgi:hypothetical protein
MWTSKNRGRYDRSKLRYPSDLTDDEWGLVEPLIPPGKTGGGKRTVIMRLGKDRIRGWDVARRARAIKPDLPVVYITGANADEWAVQGVPNSLLLTKPFAPAQLVTAVSQLLNTGSPMA